MPHLPLLSRDAVPEFKKRAARVVERTIGDGGWEAGKHV